MNTLLRYRALALLVLPLIGCETQAPPDMSRPGAVADGTATTAPGTTTSAPDVTTPTEDREARAVRTLAAEVLAAWGRADLQALGRLSPEGAGTIAPGSPRIEAMFGATGWRGPAVEAWDGTLTPVRFEGTRCLVRFTDLAGGQVGVVDLRHEGSAWRFHHLLRLDRAAFEAFGGLTFAP